MNYYLILFLFCRIIKFNFNHFNIKCSDEQKKLLSKIYNYYIKLLY